MKKSMLFLLLMTTCASAQQLDITRLTCTMCNIYVPASICQTYHNPSKELMVPADLCILGRSENQEAAPNQRDSVMKTLIALLLMTTAAMAEDCDINHEPGCNALIRPVVRIPPKSIQTQQFTQKPFDTPNWVPDEETKKRALKRAYELNDNLMCCNSIDLSQDPIVHPKLAKPIILIPSPIDENVKNHFDEQADFNNRVLVPPPDVCKRHGMRKVTSGDSWRCRK